MDGRCAAETLVDFGRSAAIHTPKITFGTGTDVLLCPGSDEIYVFNTQDRKLQVVLQFPGPVGDLVQSHDKQLLYVVGESGVYCVSLPLMLSRVQSSTADASSSPSELKISSDCLAVAEEGVSSLLVVGSVLVTLSRMETFWRLTLYKTPAEQSTSNSYEMLNAFSLPLVSAAVCDDIEGKDNKGRGRRPVLICVHCGDKPLSSSSSSSEAMLADCNFRLESILFRLTFGVDVALAKSPVILCGLPDGRLYSLPLRPPGSRLRLLHSLEQPVVFVGASIVMETAPGHARCLIAVGEMGRVVLIKTCEGGPEEGGKQVGFTEGCVPGPVGCGCVDERCLYYSTGSDLLVLELSEGSDQAGAGRGDEAVVHHEETSSERVALQSPLSLNVCRVTALTRPTHNTAAGEVQVLGLTATGQLKRITLPVRREGAGLPRIPSASGRSIRDLLSAIGDVCERASALKSTIKSKNQILRHLNHVLNVSFLLLASSSEEGQPPIQEKPITCQAMTGWSRLLQKDSLNLTCVLDNASPYVLERGWTLSITVFPLSCSHGAGGGSSSRNFSFPFLNLHPGEKLEVSLPLSAEGDTSFPVKVSCSLVFSLKSLLGEDEAARTLDLQSRHVSLALTTLTVDWLDALQVDRPFQDTSITNNIQAFLSTRQVRWSGRTEGEPKSGTNPEREQYAARVRVSSELLRATLAVKPPDLDRQGLKFPNLCVSLLDWLLSGRPGGVKKGPQGDKIVLGGPEVRARGPNGHTVKLTAKEVNVGEVNVEEESLAAVEVQVESSSMAAVCGLHHAVLCRIQTLLQRAPESVASTIKMESLALRQALQRAEGLLQQIQQSGISEAFGVGLSKGQNTRSLLGAYRELRENPLLII
ncbi:hypothetical protein LDENG_00296530 [Lucifuga dentata]|nr:hypothetical protein LDENG_00296530 [Lucifuga dentata]